MEPVEEQKQSEAVEEVGTEPVITGWVDREGPYKIYKDPETEVVTKIQVEGETFTR